MRAKTTLLYAGLAFVASLGAMEAGSLARGLLDWPVDFEETANQFDAGSFALPTRFATPFRIAQFRSSFAGREVCFLAGRSCRPRSQSQAGQGVRLALASETWF